MTGMKKRVLVVEDDGLVREMTALVLEAAGYETVGAEDGFEALNILGSDPGFLAVISDMNMPDITGMELMLQVHETLPNLPFIILTGENNKDVIQSILSQGAKMCIIKDENFDNEILKALE